MNFKRQRNLPTDTSEGTLTTPISVVDYVVFHKYKRGTTLAAMLVKNGKYFLTDTLCTLSISVANNICDIYKRGRRLF